MIYGLRRWFAFLSLCVLCGCGGSSSTVSITIESTTAFENPNVADVVIVVENQETEDGILDSDGDGAPDIFVFPTSCTVSITEGQLNVPAGCGLDPNQKGTFDLGAIPTGFSYLVEVRFRDASGTILESGLARLINDSEGQELVVAVNQVS